MARAQTPQRDYHMLIQGQRIELTLVQPWDAEYIYSLRTNSRYNQFLSAVTGTVEDQRQWIAAYKSREVKGTEYYFIIKRLDGISCGVVRLYDISNNSFTWGSWILDHNKPPKAALESGLLSFGFGFEQLNLSKALFEVRRANTHAQTFYHRFGATEVGTNEVNCYFELTQDQYFSGRDAQWATISNWANS